MITLPALLTLAALLPGAAPLKCHRNPAAQMLPAPATPAGGESSGPAARLVRPAPPLAPTVYVVDGRVVDRAAFDAVDRATIESISVVCSDERHRAIGVEPGRALVLVSTRAASRSPAKAEARPRATRPS